MKRGVAVGEVQCGVAAVWVSNHGGRQLDASPATARALVTGQKGLRRDAMRGGATRRESQPGAPGRRACHRRGELCMARVVTKGARSHDSCV